MKTSVFGRFRVSKRIVLAVVAMIVFFVGGLFIESRSVSAAPGINQQINFQGRLFNSQGATVADGTYNLQFKLYQDGAGDTAGNPGGTLEWTENHLVGASNGVTIKNGYLSVQLGSVTAFGSSVDWNQDTLWLSINIGNTASCTITTDFNTDCGGDGEMLPMKRLSSTPFSLNSARLGGRTAAGFIQNTTTPQSANIAIQSAAAGDVAVVIQGAVSQTGDLLQLQDSGGATLAKFDASGNLTTPSVSTTTLDTATATALDIGNANATTVNIATNAAAHGINIGTGAAAQTVTIGSQNTTSSLKLQSGDGGTIFTTDSGAAGYDFRYDDTASVFNIDGTGRTKFKPVIDGANAFVVSDATDTNAVLSVNTSTGVTSMGGLVSYGITNYGALSLLGGTTVDYITPQGSDVATKINIPAYDPGAFGQLVAMGLPSGASTTSRVLSIFDNRAAGDNQAPLAVFTPDEQKVFGLGTDGSNTTGYLKATSGLDLGVKIGTTTPALFKSTGEVLIQGTLDTQSAATLNIGTTNATSIALNQDTVVAAGKSLKITGSGTRPASPTAGMVYYDTTTNQLLTYNGTKWMSDSTDSVIVAASDSSQADKDAADYVADGTADDVEINAALNALPTNGGVVLMLPGTYEITATITVDDNQTLAGNGNGTVLQSAAGATVFNLIENQDQVGGNNNITLRDFKIDGNKDNVTGARDSIELANVGSGSGNSTVPGFLIENLYINDSETNGIDIDTSDNSVINNVTVVDSGSAADSGDGIQLDGSSRIKITNSLISAAANDAIAVSGSNSDYLLIQNNTLEYADNGINVTATSKESILDGNIIQNNSEEGIFINSSNVSQYYTISNNFIGGNTLAGIRISSLSYHHLITGNTLHDNDSAGTSAHIAIDSSANITNNRIIGNNMRDSAYDGTDAINVGALSGPLYLADNTFTGTDGIVTNGNTNVTFASQTVSVGGVDTVFRQPNSANAFQIQNAAGSALLTVDSENSQVIIGSAASDPSANLTNGAMYYNTTDNKFRCYENGAWTDCIATSGASSLQGAYDGGDTIVLGAGTDTGVKIQNNSTPITGNLFEVTDNGGSNNYLSVSSSDVNIGVDTTIAAGKSLTITGSGTRPASPTAGMVYYDTTTNQLLTYNGTKWMSDQKTASKIVAASDSSQAIKDGADYVADDEAVVGTGTIDGDQIEINAAIAALPASGGAIYLAEGTYHLDASIELPDNVKLSGAGDATIVSVNDSFGSGLTFITNSDTSGGNNNITIRDIQFDGNRANNGSTIITAISFTNVGSGTGSTALPGANITNNTFTGIYSDMISLTTSNNNILHSNSFTNGGSEGIYVDTGLNNQITNNAFNGIYQAIEISDSEYTTISNNIVEESVEPLGAIDLNTTSNNNTISSNRFHANDGVSLRIAFSFSNTITSNTFYDNGGTGAYSAIHIQSNSDDNVITNNNFTDTAGTGYAINIDNSGAARTVLGNNSLRGTGADSINDAGTDTVYAGQTTSANGEDILFKQANSSSAFQIQNAAGDSLIRVNSDIKSTSLGTDLYWGSTTLTGRQQIIGIANTVLQNDTNSSQFGFQLQPQFDLSTVSGGSLGNLYGFASLADVSVAPSGTIGNAYAQYVRLDNTANASITNGYGLRVGNSSSSGIVNKYGLFIDNVTGGSGNNYQMYVGGPSSYLLRMNNTGKTEFKTMTNTTDGFQVKNSSATAILNVDTDNARVGINTDAPTADLSFGGNSDRTINLVDRSTNAAGRNLTVSAGAAGAGASAFGGGTLTLQGGAAAGTGSANGGNVTLSGGSGTGSGVDGLVVLSTATFSTTTNDANCYTGGALVAGSCTIALTSVNSSAGIIVGVSTNDQTVTLPDPTLLTAGRIVYITAANGSSDFKLLVNGGGTGNEIAMRQNSSATMLWNGADWTAAGASSSTTLQSAYDNTLQSAGGAELIVSKTSATNGLTIRDSSVNPVNGALLSVQTSSAAGLFSVNSNVKEYTTNSGAETAGASASQFPASTWSALGGATVSRYTTAGNYVATGQASVSVATTAAANDGVKNTLSEQLVAGTTYNVSFTSRLASGNFTDLEVYYSVDGTANSVLCTENEAVTLSYWKKINCTFTAPSSGITSSNALFVRQAGATARTFYIDNASITIAADYNYASDGGVSDSGNFATNWVQVGGATVSRSTTVGYNASDSAEVITTGANQGIKNNMSISPLTDTTYRVTAYSSSTTTGFNSFTVRYSRDGGTSFVDCADYNTQSISGVATNFTKVTCYITTDSTTPTDPDMYFTQTDATGRTFYIDNVSITLNSTTTPNVQIGGGSNGGPTTLFTLDRGASAPIASDNDALLGSMYYDTTLGKLQCYEADGWGACGSSPDNIVTISPEYTNAVLNGTGIGTMTSDLCSDALNINDGSSGQATVCGTNETYNFYKWTSPQATAQTYSIYVTYQLPATFKDFEPSSTSLMGRTDSTNATVNYQVYRNNTSTGLTACGSAVSVSTGSVSAWQTGLATGTADPSVCGFVAGDSIVFKISTVASSNANAYVGNLGFTFSNR